MILGIVGHEAKKFTAKTEQTCREVIVHLLAHDVTCVVSGGCHLGGVDIYAVEEAKKLGIPFIEHRPVTLQWSGGYRERNIKIAEDSDKVICIVVKEYPQEYRGMRFNYCYHCGTDQHIKSGGCWTARYAGKIGKQYEIIEL